jgi:hypothetical protein
VVMNDMRNFRKTRTEQFRQAFERIRARFVAGPVSLTLVQFADLAHFIIGKESTGMLRPRLSHPGIDSQPTSFRDRVSLVFEIRAKKQVIRSCARWVIAVMQNIRVFWDRAVVKFPRNTMRLRPPSWIRTDFDYPVTESRRVAKPQPAAISLLDFAPKAFCECFGGAHEGGRF